MATDPLTEDPQVLVDAEDARLDVLREEERLGYARALWIRTDNGHRSVLHRLRCLVRDAEKVAERGPDERHDSELMLNVLLDEWGHAETIKTLAWIAIGH